jgi:hypothetical protein
MLEVCGSHPLWSTVLNNLVQLQHVNRMNPFDYVPVWRKTDGKTWFESLEPFVRQFSVLEERSCHQRTIENMDSSIGMLNWQLTRKADVMALKVKLEVRDGG